MEPRLPPDFKEFLRLLNAKGVEYLLIGGYAVGYHGYPRATNDLDVWIAVSPANAERMVVALKEFGFALPSLSCDLFLRVPNIVRMGVVPMRIEVITSISGVSFDDCYAARVRGVLDDVPVDVISLADLKANKRASGRPKDVSDLQYLP